MDIQLIERLQKLFEEDLFPSASKEDIKARGAEAERLRVESLVDDIYSWVSRDVSKEQIKNVLWAIMMSANEINVKMYVQRIRADYEDERRKVDEVE